MAGLTHFDNRGQAHMVDISQKNHTNRIAVATGWIKMQTKTFDLVVQGSAKKGDVLNIAQLAGIMGAKKTPDLIPLCHPLTISKVSVELTVDLTVVEAPATCGTAATQQGFHFLGLHQGCIPSSR